MFHQDFYCCQFECKIFNLINSFINLNYYDDVLMLKKPKLINLLNVTSSHSKLNSNNFEKDGITNMISSVSRFDKKHKPLLYEQESIKSKKLKSKSGKSKRKSSNDIENVKLFVNRSNELLTQDLLDRPSSKSRKVSNKGKKKEKLKLEIFGNNISEGNLESKVDTKFLNSDLLEKTISLTKPLSIQELSIQINIPEAEIITYLFLSKGISATINQVLDIDIMTAIAKNYGFYVIQSSLSKSINTSQFKEISESSISIKRSPIITILGHVDHGKTTLLDSILKTNLVSKEYGGITQTISGYEIIWNYDSHEHKLLFLDTPGHESFKKMRFRGAQVTDIVLLVIAIDDGLKPQTIESIEYIKEMNLSCIVVITKSDKPLNNKEKIKQDLASYDLLCEEWGGNIPIIEVSAILGQKIDKLLSQICTLYISKNLFANPQELAVGTIIESYLDKKQGSIANVIIQNGTLKLGDIIASDNLYGKVKSLTNISNIKIKSSGPSSIVQVLGFGAIPQAGSLFCVFRNEKDAKNYCLKHTDVKKFDIALKSLNPRITLDISSNVKQLKLILKTDTQGALEAILDLLGNIPQSKVQLNIVSASLGNISNTDVELALATESVILAFNVNILSQISTLLKKYKINFKVFTVIYDLFLYVQSLMLNLIDPEYDKVLIGHAFVQTVFNMNKGYVAGCLVNKGRLNKSSYIHVYRNNAIIHQGFITSLKRMKNDVEEVIAVNECGLMSNFELWQNSDIIEVYDLVIKEKTL
uniref:Translation initiation factor IF-2, chloroplastic n=1 Tax=Polysiphonia sp. TaxID=1967842 RepID=A0A1Z1M3G8_9FLOR|nr:translation initiation factor 2 [Polysiphonia sp.]